MADGGGRGSSAVCYGSFLGGGSGPRASTRFGDGDALLGLAGA